MPLAAQTASRPDVAPHDAIPLRRRSVELARLIRSTLEPLEREATALDVELRVEAPDDLAQVVVDPEKLAWVIATLVGNALRYVRRGTRRLPGGTVTVRVREDRAREAIVITVADDGPGIAAEKLPYLFERRAGSQHAVGLALTLVGDILAAHGGAVSVESDVEPITHGTSVHLTLPTGGAASRPSARSST